MLLRALLFALLAVSSSPVRAGETTVVPKRVIYPGEVIAADAVEEVALVRGNRNLGPIAMAVADVEGKVARRTLLPGRLIATGALRAAWLVQTGKAVSVTFAQGALTITGQAVALANGGEGDVVRLRNPDGGKVFSGVVLPDGSVRVGAS